MTSGRWEDYFQPGERLLWQGAPAPGFHDWPQLVFMSIFGTPFLAAGSALSFGGLWFATQSESPAQLGMTLLATVFGLPFLGIGLYLVIGQWLMAQAAPRRIRYALSTRAAYVAKRFWARDLAIYPISAGTALELKSRRGVDKVVFYSHRENDSDGTTLTQGSFDNIADGAQVLRMMRELQAQT
jgi:hypothetical protein